MRVINIFSPSWDTVDSYGRLATELADGLSMRGIHVNRFGEDAPHEQQIHFCTGGIFLGYPTLYPDWLAQYPLAAFGKRVAITMYESTVLLDGWVEELNKCDTVIVPATFLVDVFRDNGVTSDLAVVPLGISEEFLTHDMRHNDPDEPITFFALADRGVRKGGLQKALPAFNLAFGDDMNYRLILKSRADGALSGFTLTNPNIETIAADLSNAELAALYSRCDAMIFPTCGEGFGLPPREFAATNGVAIATDWGGTADNLWEWGVPLPYSMQSAWADKPSWFGKQGEWADVDVHELARTLRIVADNIQQFLEDAVSSGQFARETYTWSSFVEGVQQVWQQQEVAHATH